MIDYTVTVSVCLKPNQAHHVERIITTDKGQYAAAKEAFDTTPGAYYIWDVTWNTGELIQPFPPKELTH